MLVSPTPKKVSEYAGKMAVVNVLVSVEKLDLTAECRGYSEEFEEKLPALRYSCLSPS